MNSRLLPLIAVAATLLVNTSGWAAKPEWVEHGKNKKTAAQQEATVQVQIGAYFGDDQRQAVRLYYGTQASKGRCPPGLAKKKNGCLPPGQAKKWVVGKPLPSTVVWYPVPNEVVVQIGLPPKGYKYVRVANDILLIAVGTSLVVDAIEDLMR
ncbi:DUF1236 domain-containing protein [Rhodoferax sp.]|uniref:DUF1236 domain-containing protein n=1 Tax=Rhodoferax sp. TaxID=50421 RepID=UPI002628F89D|nr:DUF1236 domain-containing protein [Rhodoferax sp.]MDD2926546.1 DUF1236 domain-containing protein [Rhodoferax sp.]